MNAKSRSFYEGEGFAASLRLMADGIEEKARQNPFDFHVVQLGDDVLQIEAHGVREFVRELRKFADSV
jgi:hypothetical protein